MLAALPALLLTLAASQFPATPEPINIVGSRRKYGQPFISPMGEPFRQRVPNDDPIADWFNQADRNHDGYLTADEMAADADRFFAILDTNHDGRIDGDEIDYYEQVIAPEVSGEPLALQGPQPVSSSEDSEHRESDPDRQATRIKGGGGVSAHTSQGAGRYSLIDNPEPVTAADTDFNGSVSLAEFRRAARRRFGLLDAKQSGALTLQQLER
ncbi:MAG TPA: EF-hand domain-containing protein [Sphingomicrobium sp.]